jgi:hypothetical protein
MKNRDQGLRRLVFLVGGLETIAVIVVVGVVIASGQFVSGEELSAILDGLRLWYLVCRIWHASIPRFFCIHELVHATRPGLVRSFPPIAYVVFVYA